MLSILIPEAMTKIGSLDFQEYIRRAKNGRMVKPFGSGWKDSDNTYYRDTIDGIIPADQCILEEYKVPPYGQVVTRYRLKRTLL